VLVLWMIVECVVIGGDIFGGEDSGVFYGSVKDLWAVMVGLMVV